MTRARRARAHVVVLGEVLIDLFPPKPGVPLAEAAALVPMLGGAPANVAVQLARLGVPVRLISAVGADAFGARALRLLRAEGVDVNAVRTRADRRTGLTLVELAGDGERRFTPFRERSADLSLGPADVEVGVMRGASIVHTGTVSLRMPSARAATARLVRSAHRAGALVSLDVNLRWGMFPSRTMLVRLARAALRRADVLKATREEARVLLDAPSATDQELALRLLARGPRLVLLTADAEGALVATARATVHVSAPQVRVVDATGAGDAFVGAVLASLQRRGVDRAGLAQLDAAHLHAIGRAGCAAGAAAVSALGATTAMPRRRRS
ncbi:MAG: carbohydrate kinase [Deltaproteobacteria bacterium]|nr:carbohydrate kinase [Deltaproteobacteria bacterium]